MPVVDDPGHSVTGVIHVTLRATGSHSHGVVGRISTHPLHQGEINNQPVIATP